MNAWIVWSKDYALGIDEIDEQHQELLKILNRLYDAVNSGACDEKKLQTIALSLIRYTKYHFEREEFYLIRGNYSGYNEHKAEHDLFISRTQDFHWTILGGDTSGSKDMLDYLKNWLVDHIQGSDRQYVPFISKTAAQSA